MNEEPVFKKTGRNGETYLCQAQGDGYVSIEIDGSDLDMAKLVEDAMKEKDLSKIVQYRRDKKKKE